VHPWNRVLHEKLIITQLVKKFPASHGTGRFITVSTRAYHWTVIKMMVVVMTTRIIRVIKEEFVETDTALLTIFGGGGVISSKFC
jgi:hypothetical protein